MSAREQIRPQLENYARLLQEIRAERDKRIAQANGLEKTLDKYAKIPGAGRTLLTISGEKAIVKLRSEIKQLDSQLAKAEEDYNGMSRLAKSIGIEIAEQPEEEEPSSGEEEPTLSEEAIWDMSQRHFQERCQGQGESFYWQPGSFETRQSGNCLERARASTRMDPESAEELERMRYYGPLYKAPLSEEAIPPPIPAFPSELLGLQPREPPRPTTSEEEEFVIPPPPRVDRDECVARGATWLWERNHCINTEERRRCLERGAPYVWERNRCVRKRGARKTAAEAAAAMASPSATVRRPPALVLSPGSGTMIPTPSYYGRRKYYYY